MIIRNAIRCNICGDEIESKHRHDFVTCNVVPAPRTAATITSAAASRRKSAIPTSQSLTTAEKKKNNMSVDRESTVRDQSALCFSNCSPLLPVL